MAVIRTACTLMIALAFGMLGRRLRVPAGALIFSIFATAAFNLLTGFALIPDGFRPFIQIVSGVNIGCAITKKDIGTLKTIWISSVLMTLGLIAMSFLMGGALHKWGGMSMITALFASAQGGSDLILIADELGADTGIVSVFQLSRILFVCLVYPAAFRALKRRWPKFMTGGGGASAIAPAVDSLLTNGQKWRRFLITAAIASLCGVALNCVHLSAAFILGAIVGSCAFSVATSKAFFPKKYIPVVQAAMGSVIGMRITRDTLLCLPSLWTPLVIQMACMIIFTLVLGFLMHIITKCDLITSLIACSPGGIGDMAIIAQELDCNVAQVVALHTFRILVIIATFPSLFQLTVRFL